MRFSWPTAAILTVTLVALSINFSLKNWEKPDRVIEWDVHGYYGYLPAYFIYDDVAIKKSNYWMGGDRYLFWPVNTPDGGKVFKMSMGTAYFYAPFFFIAHAFALATDYPEDGFSEPYKFFLLLSAIFFLILGLDMTRRILNHYGFSDKVVAITILLIGLGTNLLCYASQSAPMSHVYSYFLFACFLWLTIRWCEQPNWKYSLLLGLIFGWITLVRPSNAVVGIIFILYGVNNFSVLKDRATLFLKKYRLLLPTAAASIVVWIPQLLYWKEATGSWIYYSYNDEGFFFTKPELIQGLFGFRKGWLIYTPMMIFALMGLYFMKNKTLELRTGLLFFIPLNAYIILSWWCWWYGGAFGQRSFIESYVLLSVPLASFVAYLSPLKGGLRGALTIAPVFFIWLNIFQTYQFESGSIHHDGMNWNLYKKQFARMDKVEAFDALVTWPNYKEAQLGHSCEIDAEQADRMRKMDNAFARINKTELERKIVTLKAQNEKYLCADGNEGDRIIANRDEAMGWETFTMIIFENNECAVMAYNGKFWYADLNGDGEILASRDDITEWGTFVFNQSGNAITLKLKNGMKLGLMNESNRLIASRNADAIKFIIEEK